MTKKVIKTIKKNKTKTNIYIKKKLVTFDKQTTCGIKKKSYPSSGILLSLNDGLDRNQNWI